MKAETISIVADDGHSFDCAQVTPESATSGGVVIIQEIFGVTEQLIGVARLYAEHGYQVCVPALFDRQGKGLVIPFDQGSKARSLMETANLDHAMADIKATVTHLQANNDKVAVMGFCWGGGLALRSAQKLDLAGAIIFYGTRMTNYLDSPLNVPVLGHFGSEDAHVPANDLQKIQNYFPTMESHVYQAGHAFANDARADYVADAATLAHQRNRLFLNSVLS